MKTKIVNSPRFGMIKITKVFENKLACFLAGYNESAHVNNVYGKSVDVQTRDGMSWVKFEWAEVLN